MRSPQTQLSLAKGPGEGQPHERKTVDINGSAAGKPMKLLHTSTLPRCEEDRAHKDTSSPAFLHGSTHTLLRVRGDQGLSRSSVPAGARPPLQHGNKEEPPRAPTEAQCGPWTSHCTRKCQGGGPFPCQVRKSQKKCSE